MTKLNICVDFDGVLNTYNGWQGEEELFEPREGAEEFLKILSDNFNIIIFSVRKQKKIIEWFEKFDLIKYIYDITDKKVPAVVYIDDRAINFNGDYNDTIYKISKFKTHWENEQ